MDAILYLAIFVNDTATQHVSCHFCKELESKVDE